MMGTMLYEVFSKKYTLKVLNNTASKVKSSERVRVQATKLEVDGR